MLVRSLHRRISLHLVRGLCFSVLLCCSRLFSRCPRMLTDALQMLTQGLWMLTDGFRMLEDGIWRLTEGLRRPTKGLQRLTEEGLRNLTEGLRRLTEGLRRLILGDCYTLFETVLAWEREAAKRGRVPNRCGPTEGAVRRRGWFAQPPRLPRLKSEPKL